MYDTGPKKEKKTHSNGTLRGNVTWNAVRDSLYFLLCASSALECRDSEHINK